MGDKKEIKKAVRAPSSDRARETVSAPSSDRSQVSKPSKKPTNQGN